MLKEQAKLITRLAILTDISVSVVALYLAYFLRAEFPGYVRPMISYLWVLIFVLPVWFVLLSKQKLFSSIRQLSILEIFARIFYVHLVGGFIVASCIYFFDKDMYSRGLYLTFIATSFVLTSVEKVALRYFLGLARKRGHNSRFLIIVGTRNKADLLREVVERHADWGLKILGFVLVDKARKMEPFHGYPTLGRIENLIDICKQQTVDEVVFCIPKGFVVDAEAYLSELEKLGITVRMVLDFYDMPMYRKEISFFHEDLPILTFHAKEFEAQQLFLKRIIDIVGALTGLFILILLLPFISLAIKLDSPGPIFFFQKRVGYNGRVFSCFKFRSMTADAEARKAGLVDNNEMSGALFKIKDDPRITRVGGWLRKISLDELPQFWNVLVGEMSLVGTRPPTPDEVEQYENWHRRRISIKPGITGLWQVSGRSQIDNFDDVVKLDLQYIDKWSIGLDIRILFKTIWVVLTRNGSC